MTHADLIIEHLHHDADHYQAWYRATFHIAVEAQRRVIELERLLAETRAELRRITSSAMPVVAQAQGESD